MTMNEFGMLWFLGGIVIGVIMAYTKNEGKDVVPWIMTACVMGPLTLLYLLVDDSTPDYRRGRVTTTVPPQVRPTPLPAPARVVPPPPTGYVYLLSNPAMPGLVKIGQTTRTVKERVAELSTHTGVPAPFFIEATLPPPTLSPMNGWSIPNSHRTAYHNASSFAWRFGKPYGS